MPYLLTADTPVSCPHGGKTQPSVVNQSVTVNGEATVLIIFPYQVICTEYIGFNPLCHREVIWKSGTTRVTSKGQPLLTGNSKSIPTRFNGGLIIGTTQTRVSAI